MILNVRLTKADLAECWANAEQAVLGGVSHVRQGAERQDRLIEDQVVGQLGEAALSIYLTGDLERYSRTRAARNARPHEGDQGRDLLGVNVDVKTSMMRRSKDPLSYRLLVRPAERTPGTVYVLALVSSVDTDVVTLVGWLAEEDLPDRVQRGGIFEGTYSVPATLLHPLPPLRWSDD